ncbi:VOC family protein [Brevibacillus fluminis]|uniref:VOC family protein n=1 Tax=Brevibacillus fluminis TaxID=511487 RepID=UPI003F8A6C77
MFQLDRLIYATAKPDWLHQFLTEKRGLTLAATGQSFPGISTRTYPFPGGGFLEVAYVTDESKLDLSEGGQELRDFLAENGDGYTSLVLETDDLEHVIRVLQEEQYPVSDSGVHEVADPTGQTVSFRMAGSYPHLPWFIQYDKPRPSASGFPQAAILLTTTLTADSSLLEKILKIGGTQLTFADMHAALFPLANATLRLESADAYSFAYFDPTGILLDGNEGE